jgi:lipopolysaccharide biosynthesis glycosyltransferase
MANFAYCFDEHYAPYAAVSIATLKKNFKQQKTIYCLAPGLSVASTKLMMSLRDEITDITIIIVKDFMNVDWKVQGHLSETAYMRLVLPNILRVNRCIYVDCDTLIQGPIEPLVDLDLQGRSIAAVPDKVGGKGTEFPLPDGQTYFNTGVLVLDLARLRSLRFTEKCIEVFRGHRHLRHWADQCIINLAFHEEILPMEPAYNFQIFANTVDYQQWHQVKNETRPNILHFVGPDKPWCVWCHPQIRHHWHREAKDVFGGEVPVVQVKNAEQLVGLANILDQSQDFEAASKVKGLIVNGMYQKVVTTASLPDPDDPKYSA